MIWCKIKGSRFGRDGGPMSDVERGTRDVVFAYGARIVVGPAISVPLLEAGGAVIDALSRAEFFIKSRLGWSLLEFLRSNHPLQEFMMEPLNTAIQLALTAAWCDRGVKPAAVLARCGGEIAGVHASGAIDFEDALDLACRCGWLIREGRGAGRTLRVFLSAIEAECLSDCSPAPFAVISDGPDGSTLIACENRDVAAIEDYFTRHRVQYFFCNSGIAVHSWVIESWKEEMLRPLRQNLNSSIPIYSSAAQGKLASPTDWAQHFWRLVREPIFLRPAIRAALDDGLRCFVEIEGKPTLREFILGEARARNVHVDALPTLDPHCSLRESMNRAEQVFGGVQPRPSHPALGPCSPEASVPRIRIDLADPYPAYARMRRTGPVLNLNWLGFGRVWVVTRYRDGIEVFKDPRFVRNPINAGGPERRDPIRGFGRDLLELDPPDHTRLRALVGKAFASQTVRRFEGRITELTGQILDRVKGRGEMELISEFASIIPITVISELLGIPIDNLQGFRNFIYALTIQQTSDRTDDELVAAKSRFTAYLHHIFARRRAAPQDDLVSSLVSSDPARNPMSDDELVGMVYLLLVAGVVTTVNLIGNGILALLRYPEQLEMFRRDPALAETAVEELLRFDSPLAWSTNCFASTDIDWGGVRIPRGASVRVLIASANRDESQFSSPDTLDITRRPCPHLSFGQGIHYCLGAPLARLEGTITLRMLVERLPELRLGDPQQIEWLHDRMFRGLRRLPIRF